MKRRKNGNGFYRSLYCILLLYSGVVTGETQLVTQRSSLAQVRSHAFEQCRNDPQCAQRFFLDELGVDENLFVYLFNRFVAATNTQNFLETSYMNSSEVQHAWLVSMRLANFCTENEYVDPVDRYCVCRPGKICYEDGNDGYDVVSLNVLCAVIVLGILYYATLHLSEFRVIYKNLVWLRKNHHCMNKTTTNTTIADTTCFPGVTTQFPQK